MFTNPYVEGLGLVLIGIACYVGGGILKIQQLLDTGALLVPLGVGYMGGHAVTSTEGAKP